MRELKNGGKEKKNKGKTGLGLGNLGIYNFFYQVISHHVTFSLVLID